MHLWLMHRADGKDAVVSIRTPDGNVREVMRVPVNTGVEYGTLVELDVSVKAVGGEEVKASSESPGPPPA